MIMVNRRSNVWLPLGMLTVLAATSFWLQEVVDSSQMAGRSRLRHDPDLIVSGFALHQLDSDGHTRYTLAARRMTHFADDDSSNFDAVSLVAFEPGVPPLNVVADQGERRVRDERVLLTGHVRVERAAVDPKEPPLVLNTAVLEVYPERKLSVAPGPVVVEHGADRLEADTMVFDHKLSVAKFTRAKASFPPQPH
jgi:lipopolysaccharide export system protein LptC